MDETTAGVLKLQKKEGVLRDPARSFQARPDDVQVPHELVAAHDLVEGATLEGPVRRGKRGRELAAITRVCGLPPERFRERRRYADLVAIDPRARFPLAASGDPSMRTIDLLAPIGKGTRGLIVSPPKAGKTMLLEKIALAIRTADAEARIIVLLIDERPEEVTQFRRATSAEVLASSIDRGTQEHVELSELTLAHIRTELECGRDVVVLVDSLTRMGRAFNLKGSGTGRTMTGGLEAGALEIPRRFFGLARNIENGGSVTIIATALVDTGSRMDQLIFEEFKGTGNSEIVLDRDLANSRIFPALNIAQTGTRKEELLYGPEDVKRLGRLRRELLSRDRYEAMQVMLGLLGKYPTNEELLRNIPTS